MSERFEHDFDDFLDELCDEVRIGSLTYSPSFVLKRVDPIAYRIAYSEWESERSEHHPESDDESNTDTE